MQIRSLKDLPTSRLDELMSLYFAACQRQDGGNYTHFSYRNMKMFLSKYITQQTGKLMRWMNFPKTIDVYRKRMKELKDEAEQAPDPHLKALAAHLNFSS